MPRATDPQFLAKNGQKLCTKCAQAKPVDAFYKRKSAPDGYRNDCKQCVSDRGRDYYETNSDHVKERARAWYTDNKDNAWGRRKDWYERVGRDAARTRRQSMTDEDRRQYNENQRAAREADPERFLRYERARRMRRYGITVDDYDTILVAQGNGCAVCGGGPNGVGDFHVDHNHETGEIRGLLCHLCNTGIGSLGDDPDRLAQAISYLQSPPARQALGR